MFQLGSGWQEMLGEQILEIPSHLTTRICHAATNQHGDAKSSEQQPTHCNSVKLVSMQTECTNRNQCGDITNDQLGISEETVF